MNLSEDFVNTSFNMTIENFKRNYENYLREEA